jgi:hypothetical protein
MGPLFLAEKESHGLVTRRARLYDCRDERHRRIDRWLGEKAGVDVDGRNRTRSVGRSVAIDSLEVASNMGGWTTRVAGKEGRMYPNCAETVRVVAEEKRPMQDDAQPQSMRSERTDAAPTRNAKKKKKREGGRVYRE